MITLAKYLSSARVAAGYTVEQAADAADVSKNTIWRIESGVSPKPGWDTVVRLMNLYNAPLRDIAIMELP